MAKLKLLSGLAYNLADSFVSTTNYHFLKYVWSLPIEKTKKIEIDLLKKTIMPKEIKNELVKEKIAQYKKWFLADLEKLKIPLGDIEKVMLIVTYLPSKFNKKYHSCTAAITAKGKVYEHQVLTSY